LPRQDLFGRTRELEVVGLAGRRGAVGQRPQVEQCEPGLIELIGGNAANHATIGVAARLIRRRTGTRQSRIPDVGIRVAVVVGRLREVSPAFECGRHPETDDVVAARAWRELLTVEEEYLVVAAGTADRAANRVAEVLLPENGPGIAVQ